MDHYQRDKSSLTPHEEALIDGLRSEVPALMEARAKRLSDEASTLPPVSWCVTRMAGYAHQSSHHDSSRLLQNRLISSCEFSCDISGGAQPVHHFFHDCVLRLRNQTAKFDSTIPGRVYCCNPHHYCEFQPTPQFKVIITFISLVLTGPVVLISIPGWEW